MIPEKTENNTDLWNTTWQQDNNDSRLQDVPPKVLLPETPSSSQATNLSSTGSCDKLASFSSEGTDSERSTSSGRAQEGDSEPNTSEVHEDFLKRKSFSFKDVLLMEDSTSMTDTSFKKEPTASERRKNQSKNKSNGNVKKNKGQKSQLQGRNHGQFQSHNQDQDASLYQDKYKSQYMEQMQYEENEFTSRDLLSFTKSHTNGIEFTNLGGPRINFTILREAVSQATSQNCLSKSMRRQARHAMIRGDSTLVLTILNRNCHLRPYVRVWSTHRPTDYQLKFTASLNKCVNLLSPSQNSIMLSKKHTIKMELEREVHDWVISQNQGLKSLAGRASLVLLSGSSYLKVDTSCSNLNLVALVPVWMKKESFFSTFKKNLLKRTEITHMLEQDDLVRSITGLFFRFNGVAIEILFSKLSQREVVRNLPMHSDHIIAGMNDSSIRAICGPRMAGLILDLVPNPTTFRQTLTAVRLWAKVRGLYCDRVGFLGGISWALAVAFTCQLMPNATASVLLQNFFQVMAEWQWPAPLLISESYDAGLDILQWNPVDSLYDRSHMMPIISPGYPSMNTTPNVSSSTLRVLQEEFVRGRIIVDSMMMQRQHSVMWNTLFEPSDFTVRYNHYLCLNLGAADEESLSQWTWHVMGRLKSLVNLLENSTSVVGAHPFPTVMDFDSTGVSGLRKSIYIGFETYPGVNLADLVNPSISYFLQSKLRTRATPEHGYNSNFNTVTKTTCSIVHLPWKALPDAIFPSGRVQATGERAKFVLRQAHDKHLYSYQSSY